MTMKEEVVNKDEKIIMIEDKKVKLTRPTIGQTTDADMEFSKAYTKALKDGLLPRIAVERQILEQGIWLPENEQKMNDLTLEMQKIIVQLKIDKDKDEESKGKLKERFNEIDIELTDLDLQKRQLFAHTAESKGDEARVSCLAWQCILNEDDSFIWKSKDEFFNAKNDDFIGQAIRQFVLFTSNVEDTIEEVMDLLGNKATVTEPTKEEVATEEAPQKEEVTVPEEQPKEKDPVE